MSDFVLDVYKHMSVTFELKINLVSQEYAFEIVVCNMLTIICKPQCVHILFCTMCLYSEHIHRFIQKQCSAMLRLRSVSLPYEKYGIITCIWRDTTIVCLFVIFISNALLYWHKIEVSEPSIWKIWAYDPYLRGYQCTVSVCYYMFSRVMGPLSKFLCGYWSFFYFFMQYDHMA